MKVTINDANSVDLSTVGGHQCSSRTDMFLLQYHDDNLHLITRGAVLLS